MPALVIAGEHDLALPIAAATEMAARLPNRRLLPLPSPDTRVDRWLDVRWDPPGSLLQTVTIVPTGRAREQGRTAHIAHLLSPEGPRRTHYWYASCFARSAYPDGAERAQAHVKGLSVPFDTEDRPVLEA